MSKTTSTSTTTTNTTSTGGSWLKSTTDAIEGSAASVAEQVRGTVGDTVANTIKSTGAATASGVHTVGQALGLATPEVQNQGHQFKGDLEEAGQAARAAAHDLRSGAEQAVQSANSQARVKGNELGPKVDQFMYNVQEHSASAATQLKANTAEALHTAAAHLDASAQQRAAERPALK